jgi:hypothetical protein
VGESADAIETAVRDLLIAVGLVGLGFGIVAVAVFGLGDQHTFVQPPEAVAEEFVRAIGNGRIEPARSMLSSEADRVTSTGELRRVATRFRSRVGQLDDVDATEGEPTHDSVVVRAQVKGHNANVDLMLPLVRENGAWSVARPTDMVAPLEDPSGRPVAPR